MARAGILKGIDGRFKIGATVVNLAQWRVSSTADDIPALGFEDVALGAAFDIGDLGLLTTVISAQGYWDALASPHTSPPGIVVGNFLTTVLLYVSKSNNRGFTFSELRVLQTEVSNDIRTRVDLSFSCKSNGSWLYPA